MNHNQSREIQQKLCVMSMQKANDIEEKNLESLEVKFNC